METGLLIKIHNYELYASPAEKNFIRQLNAEPEKFTQKNLRQIAEMTYASPATIIRLCRKLDYKGFRDFQRALVYETALSRKSMKLSMQDVLSVKSTEEIIKRVTWKNAEALEMSQKLVNAADIDRCVEMIGKARNITLYGVGSSLLVARDLYLKLVRIGLLCNIADDLHTQLLYAKTMQETDLAIIISYSGLTEEMITCARTAKENGAQTIVITRSSGSKLAKYADVVLAVATTELIIRSGAMSSRISQLNMVDVLFTTYVNRHYSELSGKFEKTQIHKSMEM